MKSRLNIAIVHFSLNFLGGAEKLCLTTIDALKFAGHKVTLVSVERTDWNMVKKNFGKVIMPDHEIYFLNAKLSKRLSNVAIAITLLTIHIVQHIFLRLLDRYDLIINTQGDLLNSIVDIVYVHFPLKASVEYSQIPPITSSVGWKIQSGLYNVVVFFLDNVPSKVILTNSIFVKGIIENSLHRDALVLYPPVDLEVFLPLAENQKRENTVITVSGFSPKKNLEIVPLIAQNTKSAKFVIVGRADEYSRETLERLSRIVRESDLEERIELLINVPRSILRQLLSRAKIYLHVMPQEHFGTAIVEGMASGCVPLVHKSGGPWLDILEQKQGKYGYAYNSMKEAAMRIDLLLNDEHLRRRIANAAMNRALAFDKTVFKKKIAAISEKLYSFKLKEGKQN